MPSFVKNMLTIGRCTNQFRSDQLEGTGLKGGQHSIIITLCHNPGISQEQLSKLTYINKSNVTRQLAHLEEAGFVTRQYSAIDKRMILVYPTEKALALLPHIGPIHQEWREYLTEGMRPEEIEQFSAILDRIAERAKQYVDTRDSKN